MTPIPTSALLVTQSDERLLALARSGHERAFEAIIKRYRTPLRRYIRRLLPEEAAEDALQQASINAWTSLSGGARINDLRPWLYRVAHNASIDVLRAGKYDIEELGVPQRPGQHGGGRRAPSRHPRDAGLGGCAPDG